MSTQSENALANEPERSQDFFNTQYKSNRISNPAQFIAERLQKSRQINTNIWMACCPAHGDKTPSFQLKEVGGKILVHCFSGCSQSAVINALRSLGLWSGTATEYQPAYFAPEPEINWAKRARSIKRIWNNSQLITEGDAVDKYLKNRGFANACGITDVRFNKAVEYWHEDSLMGEFPAMIAAVRNSQNEIISLHRTYLTEDGHKADVPKARKVMRPSFRGGISGGAIRLCLAGRTLGVAEGIETALACNEATGLPVWSCISAGGIARFDIPDDVTSLLIFADNDKSEAGYKAALTLARRAIARKVTTKILMPETVGTDWADKAVCNA